MTRTVVASGYGSPEVLVLQDIELPSPGPGQVLVDVRAAGANPVDYKLYSGQMGDDHANLPMPVGMEASGVVAAVGDGAEGYTGPLTVGDEVIVTGVHGAYADQVLADASNVGRKPSALSFEQAAGLVLTGGTAWHLLTETAVGTGDTVLVHGAGGGVGLMVVQLAAARGAKVIGTASPSRHDELRRYGVEPVAYGDGLADRVRAIGPVDVALDLVGTDEALDTSVELVADRSRIATIAGFARAGDLGIEVLTEANGGQAIRDAARPELLALADAGALEVSVDKVFPLTEAADAHRYLQEGHARGKVVLVP
ncbi:NADP-dependent oxidoreductase [Mycolicibacterium sp. GCM10028919]|uniref:NADP-dependent oxidoreductase n=1 Tax=Mycolicibacterium sp. GCM10028919 TaxID=3273401 RepID=UPI00360DB853